MNCNNPGDCALSTIISYKYLLYDKYLQQTFGPQMQLYVALGANY